MEKRRMMLQSNGDGHIGLEILEELLSTRKRKLRDIDNVNVIPDKEATRITIPASMSKLEAAQELERQHHNEEQVIEVRADFEGWNWKDVLVAIKKVSEATFGWIDGKTIETFFGKIRPKEIDVVVDIVDGKTVTEKCFFGQFQVAGWDDAEVNVFVQRGEAGIVVTCKKKYSDSVTNGYFNAVREHLSTSSIYRSKTVVVTNGKDVNGHESVNFEIIENRGEEKIILNDEEELVIDSFIIGALGEKGKRTYLFTGDYGTGKTETAMRIGREGVKQGMTFFYCKESDVFEELLSLSKLYQPCLVFLEDVDEIGAGEERDSRMNSILNTLDGVQTKGNDITVIFTTNHEDKINPALRRPGRIDLIIKFGLLNKDTQLKLYQLLMKGVKGYSAVDWNEVLEKTPDVQGAVIAQVCKRARKLAARDGGINTTGMLAALASMKYQIDFMKGPVLKQDADKVLMAGLAKKFGEAARDLVLDSDEIKDIHSYVS